MSARDNYEGMEMAVAYLKELGHRRIGYLSTALGSYIMQVRHKAFFQALRQNSLHAESTCAPLPFIWDSFWKNTSPGFWIWE